MPIRHSLQSLANCRTMHKSKGNLTIYHSYSSLNGADDLPDSKANRIRFEHCNLPVLPASLVDQLSKVVEFEAKGVSLQEISSNFFVRAKKLKIIDLSANLLKSLDHCCFEGAKNLQELNLSGNQLTRLDSCILSQLPRLVTLNLANNKLSSIDAFGGNQLLSRVDLRNNQITKLDANLFADNCRLVKVNLSRNQLQELTLELPNDALSILDVSANRLERLDLWANERNKSGSKLHLLAQQNKLASVFVVEFSVKLLNLAENDIEQLSFLDSVEYNSLSWLDVSKNQIKEFPKLNRFLALNHLNLEGNFIDQIPLNAEHLELKELFLENNRLQSFSAALHFSARFPKLTNLDLRGNSLDSLAKIELINHLGNKVFLDGTLATVESFDELADDSLDGYASDEFEKLSIFSLSERDISSRSVSIDTSTTTSEEKPDECNKPLDQSQTASETDKEIGLNEIEKLADLSLQEMLPPKTTLDQKETLTSQGMPSNDEKMALEQNSSEQPPQKKDENLRDKLKNFRFDRLNFFLIIFVMTAQVYYFLKE